MTIATNLAGVGEAGEFPCGETFRLLFFWKLMPSVCLNARALKRAYSRAPVDQDEQQNIFIALSLP